MARNRNRKRSAAVLNEPQATDDRAEETPSTEQPEDDQQDQHTEVNNNSSNSNSSSTNGQSKRRLNKKRKQQPAASQDEEQKEEEADSDLEEMESGGWKKVDLSEMHLEGFEDGCAFELEELTDYIVKSQPGGGQILVGNSNSNQKNKNKNKHKKAPKQQPHEEEEEEEFVEEEQEEAEQDEEDKEMEEPDEEEEEQAEQEQEEGDDEEEQADEADEPDDEAAEDEEEVEEEDAQQPTQQTKLQVKNTKPTPTPVSPVKLPKWDRFKLHPLLRQSLKRCGFDTPTSIQSQTIYPAVINHQDIVGAAPTGSGKTLAFGLPVLHELLVQKDKNPTEKGPCKGLILTPTRELALQIQAHLEKMVPNREIGIVSLVGGMAIQKQKRLLSYSPEIVIGTPGRLWDLIDSDHEHFSDLQQSLRFLVVDEADRMLQTGSYPEIETIFEALRRRRQVSELKNLSDNEDEDDDDNSEDDEDDDAGTSAGGVVKVTMLQDVMKMQQELEEREQQQQAKEEQNEPPTRHSRQTFLFSATLSIPESGRFAKKNPKKAGKDALSVLEKVMKRVGLRGKPAIVDLANTDRPQTSRNAMDFEDDLQPSKKKQKTSSVSLPEGLELCQHEVTDATRDYYLYYFLTQYPGRTIVFLNAIHQVRRLCGLLKLLQLPAEAIHAEMKQRQRLKKLDAFKAQPNGILVATDVAARGLDIPSVEYVVHYHIAKSPEIFVHRSGRTARAQAEGLSISLVSATDMKFHQQICKLLQRPTGLAEFPFDHRFLSEIERRVDLAKEINEEQNASGKVHSESNWFEQMAKEADLELDDTLMGELNQKKQQQKKNQKTPVEAKRAALSRMLAAPLRPVGSSRKFRSIHKEIGSTLTSSGDFQTKNAADDLAAKSKKSFKRFRRRH